MGRTRWGLGTLAPLALATAACQATLEASGPAPRPIPVRSAGAAPSPAPELRVATRLGVPAGPTARLAGHVVLDAAYMVATDAGAALAIGDRVLVAAGADLAIEEANGVISKTRALGADGAGVISKTRLLNPDGSPVISKTRLVDPDGSPVISKTRLLDADGVPIAEADGNIVSDNAAGLGANHGGGVLSPLGGNVISKTRDVLAQADAEVEVLGGDRGPALGAVLPAAGMRVGAISLRTGQPVPVGVGAGGQPAYAVYTNLAGGFTFHLPPEDSGNVLVVADVPRRPDARTRYALLAPAGTAREAVLDEDTALVTRAVREVYAGRLADIFTADPDRVVCQLAASTTMPDALRAAVQAMVEDLHAKAAAAGATADPARAAGVAVLARRVADALLAPVDLAGIIVPETGVPPTTSPNTVGRPALAVLVEVLREVREAATAKLAADPGHFDGLPFFVAANACDPGRYAVRKPADLNAFLIAEHLGNNSDPGLIRAGEVFRTVGLPTTTTGHPYASSRMTRAMDAVLQVLVAGYLGDAHGEKAAAAAILAAHDPAAPADPDAVFRAPCPRPDAVGSACPAP